MYFKLLRTCTCMQHVRVKEGCRMWTAGFHWVIDLEWSSTSHSNSSVSFYQRTWFNPDTTEQCYCLDDITHGIKLFIRERAVVSPSSQITFSPFEGELKTTPCIRIRPQALRTLIHTTWILWPDWIPYWIVLVSVLLTGCIRTPCECTFATICSSIHLYI